MMHPSLYIKLTIQKGWGVFTSKKIKAATEIEISPVLLFQENEKELINKTPLYNYIFDWENNKACLGLGYISIYNHSYTSNCEYLHDYETNTITIKTVRTIEEEEELTINYNGDWNIASPVWFNVLD